MTFTQRVTSITQDTIIPKVFDQVLSDSVATYRFLSKGKKWTGESLKFPVKIASTTQLGSFSGLDSFSTGVVETRQQLSYDLRAYRATVVIPGVERVVNKGEEGMVDLVKAEMESTANDMLDAVSTIFYADGTGNGSKDFLGLDALNDDGTSVVTLGGLSRTTYAVLKGTRTASGGTMTIPKLSAVFSAISGGSSSKQSPTIIVSDDTVWNLYEELLTPTIQANYQTNGFPKITRTSRGVVAGGELGAAGGFTSLVFKGIPWVADEKATSQTVWFINENYTEWYGAKDSRMQQATFGGAIDGVYSDIPTNNTGLQFSGMMTPVQQYGEVGHFYLLGNLVTNAPRRQGRLTGVTGV